MYAIRSYYGSLNDHRGQIDFRRSGRAEAGSLGGNRGNGLYDRRMCMPEGGTVVQIDAHADLRPSYHGSIYNHACPMNRLRQKGYDLRNNFV